MSRVLLIDTKQIDLSVMANQEKDRGQCSPKSPTGILGVRNIVPWIMSMFLLILCMYLL